MSPLASVIIPVRNGASTIARCLEAALASCYEPFEVIVVDDGSSDRSAEIIAGFPCTLIRLPEPSGASCARNVGVSHSNGEILFFTDADCLMCEDTLETAVERLSASGRDAIVGGTYTLRPADERFFSAVQSAFIHYSESRGGGDPDYIATHAMALYASTFKTTGGFAEGYLPILEDVEFSHRLRRTGHRLVMDPRIQVRHLFDYSLLASMANGFRKARYWTVYSIHNGDLLADSGTASRALKLNVVVLFASGFLLLLALIAGITWAVMIAAALMALNITVGRDLVWTFFRTRGTVFAIAASAYYFLVYPLAVGAGGLAGLLSYRGHGRALRASG